jgi:alanyl-tRNA synthetase
MWTSFEIRKKFIEFFIGKDHVEIPGVPLTFYDPTLLFVSAGMVPFKPYILGEKAPPHKRVVNCQKCFRTVDIEKVGQNSRSLTFFEMLGNWSFGDFWKKEAISFAFELLVDVFGIEKEKLFITVFEGDKEIPEDKETIEIWKELGIDERKIFKLSRENNFWIAGNFGPCGPCTEIYYDLGEDVGCKRKECQPGCDCDRFLEIWNLVFMEYYLDEKGNLTKLSRKTVDTGAGLERLALVLQGKKSVFETDLFLSIIEELKKEGITDEKAQKIIADHLKGAAFLISEGVLPSNVERGYVLRRILRRAVKYLKMSGCSIKSLVSPLKKIGEIYENVYPEVKQKEEEIIEVVMKEAEIFEKTLEKGLRKFYSEIENLKKSGEKEISGKIAFDLYQSYGFPLELTEELAKEEGFFVDKKGFEIEFEKHREISRIGAEKKFGGIGKTPDYRAIKHHTATHLLHAALRKILGNEVKQMGSDITSERLRFDFSFPRKLTKEELKQIEDLVNQKIQEDLEVKKEEMSLKEALESGALAFFKEKYPERVTVYTIGDFSKEICAGPHVKRTSELGKFKILKEESAGAGIRRIKAKVE